MLITESAHVSTKSELPLVSSQTKKKKKENQRAYTVANLAILATPLIQVKHAVNIPQMLQCYSWYGSTASTPTTSAQ